MNTSIAETDRENSAQSAENLHLTVLIGSCANRDESALVSLYNACSPHIFGVLKRLLKDDALAEDALRESFYNIWQKSPEYRPDKISPQAWLTSIARQYAIDRLRQLTAKDDSESYFDLVDLDDTPMIDFGDTAEIEIQGATMRCVDKLPFTIRECILKAYREGYSCEELSEYFQRPESTIKEWLQTGLLSLKESIRDIDR
jgi:RNA polymerase sigma-70 factor (ECF subfamily)